MARVMQDRLKWYAVGETSCPCCGATYLLQSAPLPERRDGYFRCEDCDTLMDEWICDQARRYERVRSNAEPRSVRQSASPTVGL